MTNITRQQKLDLDPARGRRAVEVFTKELSERARSLSTSRPFVAFVVVAGIVLGVYYFLLAAPFYVSEASFSIRGREEQSAAVSLLGALGGGAAGNSAPTSTDTAELQTYIQSYEMAERLDQQFHLRDVFSQPRLDFLNWMPRNASKNEYLNFYKKTVHISIDHDTNLINVKVKTFDPKLSQAMAAAILRMSSDYLNNLSAIVRRDTLRSSEQELRDAEDNVRKARLAMTAYRASTGTLDPAASALATSAGISAMQQEQLQLQADLTGLLSFNRPNSAVVQQAKAKIAGLQQQIDQEKSRIGDTKAVNNITERLRTYEGLQISSDYADKQLVAALSSYDAARTVANQRERFVVPAVAPNLPDVASEPHRLSSFLEAMLVLVAVYGIVALAIAGVRDHQGI